MIFSSSLISSSRFCSRPAVSMMRTSVPSALARVTASKARPEASEPAGSRDDRRAGALAPDLQLLDRGGAERVAGGQHHRLALAPQSCCASLPMVVVLPVPLTPTIRMTNGFLRRVDRERLRDRAEHLRDLGGEHARGLPRRVMSRSKRSRRSASVTRRRPCRRRNRPGSAGPRARRASPASSFFLVKTAVMPAVSWSDERLRPAAQPLRTSSDFARRLAARRPGLPASTCST